MVFRTWDIFVRIMNVIRYFLLIALVAGVGALFLSVVPQRIDEEMTFLQSCDSVEAWVVDPVLWSRWREDDMRVQPIGEGQFRATLASSGREMWIGDIVRERNTVRYAVVREDVRIMYSWRFVDEGNHCAVALSAEIKSRAPWEQLALAWSRKEWERYLEEQLTALQRALFERRVPSTKN